MNEEAKRLFIEENKQIPILILDEEWKGGLLKYLDLRLPRLHTKLQEEVTGVLGKMDETLDLIIETEICERMKLIRKLKTLEKKRYKVRRLLSIYWGEVLDGARV